MENIIEFKDVSFAYNDENQLLNHFSFSIKKGSYTVLLGHNGSGKSTIAKLAIGLLEAKKGSIYINNLLLNEENIYTIRNQVAIVFQNPDNQFIGSTVQDDIAFGLENRQVNPQEMDDIIQDYAAKVNMLDFLQSEPTNLSGGQKQRVAIAGALSLKPNLLILDEATSMLDPLGKKEIFEVIKNLRKSNPEMTILSITHHIEEALEADEIIIINNGHVIKNGQPHDILFDDEFLNENHLKAPFCVELAKKLQAAGIDVEKTLSLDELVSKL